MKARPRCINARHGTFTFHGFQSRVQSSARGTRSLDRVLPSGQDRREISKLAHAPRVSPKPRARLSNRGFKLRIQRGARRNFSSSPSLRDRYRLCFLWQFERNTQLWANGTHVSRYVLIRSILTQFLISAERCADPCARSLGRSVTEISLVVHGKLNDTSVRGVSPQFFAFGSPLD